MPKLQSTISQNLPQRAAKCCNGSSKVSFCWLPSKKHQWRAMPEHSKPLVLMRQGGAITAKESLSKNSSLMMVSIKVLYQRQHTACWYRHAHTSITNTTLLRSHPHITTATVAHPFIPCPAVIPCCWHNNVGGKRGTAQHRLWLLRLAMHAKHCQNAQIPSWLEHSTAPARLWCAKTQEGSGYTESATLTFTANSMQQ